MKVISVSPNLPPKRSRNPTNMRPILRFLIWLKDSLPLYSRRDLARHWFAGQEFAKKQIGVTRGDGGRFKRVST